MAHRISSAKPRTITASAIREAIGRDLATIKHEDGLTWADLAHILGKSEDQVARYCEGTAEMGIAAFYFAKREWNGRFTGTADQLVSRDKGSTPDRCKITALTRAVHECSLALEDDDEIDAAEVRVMRKTLESARDVVAELLSKVQLRSVA